MRFLIIFLTLFVSTLAQAYVVPVYRDLKPASQAMLEHQTVVAPIVATTNYIKTTYAGATDAGAVTLSSFTHQPDVPRVITITPTGTTGDVESCAIVVSGTDIYNASISDTLTFAADASTAQTSVKAFKTVSSVVWPANCESGGFAATWIIGVGSGLGLTKCLARNGDVAWGELGGVRESTTPSCVKDVAVVSKNICTLSSALNSVDVELFYVQNFACKP